MKSNELFEQIHSGYIEENSTIKVMTEEGKNITEIKYKNGGLQWEPGTFSTILLCDINIEFEVEKPKIDIQSLGELRTEYTESGAEHDMRKYINNVILPAIKQLDKRKEQ